MPTTTNFGWTTPADTDLVKDGAAAIRTLGNSIDTTTKNLNPETTTGDIAYRSATSNTNTRLAIGSAGQVLTVAAGVPSWATPSDQTPLTTKGDVFTFSTVDDRLGVGANGTVLTADSGEATGLKWAAPASSGMTLISTTTLSSSGAFNINGCFSATYDDYIIECDELVGSAASYLSFGLRTGSTNSTSGYNNTRSQFTYANVDQSNGSANGGQIEYLQYGSTNATAGGATIKLKGPFLTKATTVNLAAMADTYANQSAGQHAVATSYDSMWFSAPASGTVSGKIRIYGLAI